MKKILAICLAMVLCISFAACQQENPVVHPEAVILEKSEITLEVGQEETLVAVVDINATDRSVTWSSSDNAVATVDTNGKVTAVSEGEAIITVTTNDGGKTDTCKVIVTPAPAEIVLEVKGIDVLGNISTTDVITFRNDGTYSVYAMFLGAVEVTYESTYQVVDGVLTVPNPGPNVSTAFGEFPTWPTVEVIGDKISFKVLSNNGEDITLGYFVLSKEDAQKLGATVGEPIEEVKVTGVELTQDAVTLNSGSKLDMTGIVNVLPENATNKNYTVTIKDESNGNKILKEDSGILGVNIGTATVVITTADGGFTTECTVTVAYPDKAAAIDSENYFVQDTAFSGALDMSAFGGAKVEKTYVFKTDGTIDIYTDYILDQHGYYTLVGTEGNYTQLKMQRFLDGELAADIAVADGKMTFDAGFAGIPLLMSQCDMETDGHFASEVTYEGTLDLSAFVPGLVQQKTMVFAADGTFKMLTDGVDGGAALTYGLISINGNVVSIVLDMGSDGVHICNLPNGTDSQSFTIAALGMEMTRK